MKLPVTGGECPWCYKKIPMYNSNEYKYGSPIISCKSCGKKYIDKRFHELACEGMPQGELNEVRYKNFALIGLAIAALAFGLCLYRYWAKGAVPIEFAFMTPIALLVAILNFIELIKVKTGKKQKMLEERMRESEERLKDPIYAAELEENGYIISK